MMEISQGCDYIYRLYIFDQGTAFHAPIKPGAAVTPALKQAASTLSTGDTATSPKALHRYYSAHTTMVKENLQNPINDDFGNFFYQINRFCFVLKYKYLCYKISELTVSFTLHQQHCYSFDENMTLVFYQKNMNLVVYCIL